MYHSNEWNCVYEWWCVRQGDETFQTCFRIQYYCPTLVETCVSDLWSGFLWKCCPWEPTVRIRWRLFPSSQHDPEIWHHERQMDIFWNKFITEADVCCIIGTGQILVLDKFGCWREILSYFWCLERRMVWSYKYYPRKWLRGWLYCCCYVVDCKICFDHTIKIEVIYAVCGQHKFLQNNVSNSQQNIEFEWCESVAIGICSGNSLNFNFDCWTRFWKIWIEWDFKNVGEWMRSVILEIGFFANLQSCAGQSRFADNFCFYFVCRKWIRCIYLCWFSWKTKL